MSLTIQNPRRQRTVRWSPTSPAKRALIVLLVLLAILLARGLTEPYSLSVDRTVITSPDVPPGFDGARIVFLADVHTGRAAYRSRRSVAKLVARVNAEKPDVVILGGDYVGGQNGGDKLFYPEIAKLVAPSGVVAAMGNHDIREGRDVAVAGFASANIPLVVNGSVTLQRRGGHIRVAVVDDPWAGSDITSAAADGISPSEFAIFVAHTPDTFPTALPATDGVFDLALAGHTHGGQVTLFGLYAPVIPSAYGQRYRGGWRTEQGIPVLVTRGIGTTGLPLRFFAQPQFHVIELRRGPADAQH